MAISTGVRVHRAWLDIDGTKIKILEGSVDISKAKKSSTFSATVPLRGPLGVNMDEFWRDLGENETKVMCITSFSPAALVGEGTPLLTGEIDKAKISFVTGTVHVSGRCKSAKLHQNRSAEKFVNQKPSDIVATLAKRAGLTAETSPSILMAGKKFQIDFSKMTDGVSYASILHKMADLEGAKWWTDRHGKLIYKSASDGTANPVYSITYVGPTAASYAVGDCLHLDISRNIQAGKSITTKVHSWNQKEKKIHKGEAKVPGAAGNLKYTYHIPNLTPEHAEKHAKSKAKDHSSHELTLTAECVGDPDIDVAMDLQLTGNAFAQTFELQTIHHSIGKKHSMRLAGKSAKAGRTPSSSTSTTGPNINQGDGGDPNTDSDGDSSAE